MPDNSIPGNHSYLYSHFFLNSAVASSRLEVCSKSSDYKRNLISRMVLTGFYHQKPISRILILTIRSDEMFGKIFPTVVGGGLPDQLSWPEYIRITRWPPFPLSGAFFFLFLVLINSPRSCIRGLERGWAPL